MTCDHDQRLYARRCRGTDFCSACAVIKKEASQAARRSRVGLTDAERLANAALWRTAAAAKHAKRILRFGKQQ